MKEFLSEEEAKVSRTITKISKNMPYPVSKYAYYLEDSMDKSIGTIYLHIRNIRLFYSILAEELKMEVQDISIDLLTDISNELIEKYISAIYMPRKSNSEPKKPDDKLRTLRYYILFNYFDYLLKQKLISNCTLMSPQKRHEKNVKSNRITSSDKVRFKIKGWVKTTTDGKYSIIKEKVPGGGYAKYRFYVKDELNDTYFTDENREIMYFNGNEARAFVKKLYDNLL